MARKKNKGTKRGEKENAQTKADAFAAQVGQGSKAKKAPKDAKPAATQPLKAPADGPAPTPPATQPPNTETQQPLEAETPQPLEPPAEPQLLKPPAETPPLLDDDAAADLAKRLEAARLEGERLKAEAAREPPATPSPAAAEPFLSPATAAAPSYESLLSDESLLAAIGGAADVDDAPLSASDRARLALETMRSEAAAFARAKKESPAPSPVVAPPRPPPPPAREEAVADEDEGARERLRLASERAKAMMASFRAEASAYAEEKRAAREGAASPRGGKGR